MKIIKRIFLLILLGVALVLLVAVFLPRKYKVEHQININSSNEMVFKQISDLNNLRLWNAWPEMSSDSKQIISETTNIEGATWQWENLKTGNGNITITEAREFTDVKARFEIQKPWALTANAHWEITEKESHVELCYILEGKLSYPIERYKGLFMEQKIGKLFDKSLQELKQRCENE